MNETLVILIGNSDDKLSQAEWATYLTDLQELLDNWASSIHFAGTSLPNVQWQNACWVIEYPTGDMRTLNTELSELAAHYRQDSIAVIVGGHTTYVTP